MKTWGIEKIDIRKKLQGIDWLLRMAYVIQENKKYYIKTPGGRLFEFDWNFVKCTYT